MKINFGVTITGADDYVDPRVLLALSERHPKVERCALVTSSVDLPTSRVPSWAP